MHQVRRLSMLAAALCAALSPLAATAQSAPVANRYEASNKQDVGAASTSTLGGRGAGSLLEPFAATLNTEPTVGDQLATAECPPELQYRCHVALAAYAQNNPDDKSDYGNYDLANRPAGGLKDAANNSNALAINSIVIHDTEGTLQSTLNAFSQPNFYASAHYVIDTDGSIYQTVPTKDIAWHAGNWYVNQHSIGIEHVGHAVNGGTEYTQAMYVSSALLVRWLANKYHIALDRQHILGHDNVPAPTTSLIAGMHWDPGAYWNWEYYMAVIGAPITPTALPGSQLIAITPHWMINRPEIDSCSGNACTTLPSAPANFVYLHTQPSSTAPLISEPNLHPDNAAGTMHIDDWSAKASYGQVFAVAARAGDWVGIYYGGQNADGSAKIGWFQNPYGLLNAMPVKGAIVTPKAGLTSIPVYGRAYPETSAYNGSQATKQSVVALDYTISADQNYATSGSVPTDYYWAWNIDSSLPDDHTTIIGQDVYYQIQFNHRIAFVKASDVNVSQIH